MTPSLVIGVWMRSLMPRVYPRPCLAMLQGCYVIFFLAMTILPMVLHSGLVNARENRHDAGGNSYVGAERCQACHSETYSSWQRSHHYRAMQEVSPTHVLGNFAGVTVNFHGIRSRFYREKNKYFVETLDEHGKRREFEVRYTFGFYPLQQYLVPLEDGHIQALNIAWDSRSVEDGGQRWFHLQPDENIQTEHPFFWTRHFQNWNGRCADCHSTNLQKNYNAANHSFETTWADINVACESCHGPGALHIKNVETGKYSTVNTGFAYKKHQDVRWRFIDGMPTAQAQGTRDEAHIDMCGDCHSLRVPLDESNMPGSYHNRHALQLPVPPLYFADGQIREEVFVLGSFLQSKMYESGVTCTNCHEPHSNALLIEGNGLCAQCHDAKVFDASSHHHHPVGSDGAECVNCHMPSRRYMRVDDRRDHRFGIPRPDLSIALNVPNACTQCHAGEDNHWALAALSRWDINLEKVENTHWAKSLQAALGADPLALKALGKQLQQDDIRDINKAAMLSALASMPSPESLTAATPFLTNANPLVRRGAVMALRDLPPLPRWQALSPLLSDNSASVRYALAEVLADLLPQVPQTEASRLKKLVDEYRTVLTLSADFPATQLSLATLETRLGNMPAAEKAFLHALKIEPNFVPALLNLADFYRMTGRDKQVPRLLRQALKIAPDSGAAHHSYGLYLVRQKQYAQALAYLQQALNKEDAQAQYAYVYAVALENQGKLDEAISTLVQANQRWPRQYSVLLTLVLYLERSGKTFSIPQYVRELQKIAPESPQVRGLLQKYGSAG